MKIKQISYSMYSVSLVSFIFSLYFISQEVYLSIILLSGSIFFLFLSKNPELLRCSNIKEIDRLIPNLQGKSYLIGAFIILIVNLVFY